MLKVHSSLLLDKHRSSSAPLKALSYDFSLALPSPSTPPPPPQPTKHVTVKTNKQKTAISVKEKEHLQLVLQHPSYQSNPAATIKEHLLNVLKNSAREGNGKDGEAVKKKQKVKRNGSAKRRSRLTSGQR